MRIVRADKINDNKSEGNKLKPNKKKKEPTTKYSQKQADAFAVSAATVAELLFLLWLLHATDSVNRLLLT